MEAARQMGNAYGENGKKNESREAKMEKECEMDLWTVSKKKRQ
jgi:hypothetical protein